MIKVKNLSKVFNIPHEKRLTLFENLVGLLKDQLYYEKFYALKNINLEVAPGEFVGLIGANGSGKSTLLKIISGILPATKGQVTVAGPVIPLLELGLGFQPDLSGRENVFLYGIFMGISRKELEERIKKIFEFAELEKFIDMPLKNYSSGMQARLAFATAIQTSGDIYLVDEVLAVGDAHFYKKCLEVFRNFKHQGKTLLLVSHNLDLVASFCEKTLFLSAGQPVFYGPTEEAVVLYQKEIEKMNEEGKIC